MAIASWTGGMLASELELSGHGLVSGLSPIWYVGLVTGLAGLLAAIATHRHHLLLTSYGFSLAMMISATGVLLERGPRFPYIYNSYLYGDGVLRTAAIDYSQTYVSWPGWHVVTAAAVGASGIDPNVLLTWLPLWLLSVTLLGMMTLFGRYRLPWHQRWIAVALAVTCFLGPSYPVPGSMGLILLIYLMALVVQEYTSTRVSGRGRAGMCLLLSALVVTHLLTAAVGIVDIFVTSIIVVLVLRRRAGVAGILGIALMAGYLFYVAVEVTAQLLPGQIETILSLDRLFGSIFGSTARSIGGGSADHLDVVRLRVAFVIGLAILGGLGGLTAIISRTPLRRWFPPSAWDAGGAASIMVGGYGGEILARGAALASPGTVMLASWLARHRPGRLLLAAAMLAGIVLAPINLYGNELFDYVRPSELAADAVLAARHPTVWNLGRPSRTWHGEAGISQSGPFVIVYGPLYDRASVQIGVPNSPSMPYWSYENGDVRIMISSESLK